MSSAKNEKKEGLKGELKMELESGAASAKGNKTRLGRR